MGIGNYNRKVTRFTDWGVAVVAFLAAAAMLLVYLDLPESALKRRIQVAVAGFLSLFLSGFYFYRILAADGHRHGARPRALPATPPEAAHNTQQVPTPRHYIQPPRHRARRRLPPSG